MRLSPKFFLGASSMAPITPLVIPLLPHLPVEFNLSQLASLSSSVSANLPPFLFLALMQERCSFFLE